MNETFLLEGRIFARFNDFRESRRTLVLVHGLSGSMSAWKKFVQDLGDDHNLLLVDLRGHGRSARYPRESDYRIECFAQDLAHTVQHFRIQSPVFVAHSFGCLVVAEYLIRHQARAGKAVFISARLDPRSRTRELLASTALKLTRAPRQTQTQLPPKRHIDYALYPSHTDLDPRRTWADISNTTPFAYLCCMKHVARLDYRERLHEIRIPTLIFHGSRDLVFDIRHIAACHRRIPGSRMRTIPGANHLPVFTHPELLIREIAAFASEEP